MNSDKLKVYIYPSCDVIYSSYYIKGLYDIFGKRNVAFSTKYFTDLKKKTTDNMYDSYMAIVILGNGQKKKLVIDFGDDYPVRENAYNWCHVYAKINYDPNRTGDKFKDKITSIPPSFGIKIWNIFEALYFSLFNLIKLKLKLQISFRSHFHCYLSQVKALRLEHFSATKFSVDENLIFFVASLWAHSNCLTGTNMYRKMFVESCLKKKVNFQGGFLVTDRNHPQFNQFKQLIITRRYPLKDYIEKTKKSVLVFNTPAVHNCHGWKLGQFLAMNKAIISTAIQNKMPEELVHGENIHFVTDENDMNAAISLILNDENYRKKLENEARNYYLRHVTPISVITQICHKLQIDGKE